VLIRDTLVLLTTYGLLPFVPFRPFLGLLLFSWFAYMRPQDLAWHLSATNFSDYIVIAMIAGLLFSFSSERWVTWRPQSALMLALLLWVGLSVQTAVLPGASQKRYILFAKMIGISLLSTGLARTERRFKQLYWVIAGSLGLLGTKYGLFGLLHGGATISQGPGGFMMDNNGLALGLVVGMPLVAGIAMAEKNKWLRLGATAATVFTGVAVTFTFSRGGLIALAAVSILLVLRSGRPVLATTILALGILAYSQLTSAEFQKKYRERAETIRDFENVKTAQTRMAAWQTAMAVAREYPIFGVGPGNFMVVYRRFGDPLSVRATHNAFLEWLADSGFPAMIMFIAMLVITVLRMAYLEFTTKLKWVAAYARAIQISIAGFVVGGMMLDKAYYDLVYHIVALSVCLELAAEEAATAPTALPAPAAPVGPWWRQVDGRAA
jgi:probable O-glycosylation ligase (exosortase A-associated)